MNKRSSVARKWGSTLLMLVVVTFVLSAFSLTPYSGSVVLLIKNADGTKSVESYSLSDRAATQIAGINVNTLTSASARLYQRSDGSVIGLTPAGVVSADIQNRTTVLIASPIAPTLQTPLAVWNGGEKIAWISPADRSLQVFARTERGTYLPVALDTSLQINSIGFTDDGSTTVVARYIKDGTELYAMNLSGGKLTKVGVVPGVASIIPTP